MKTGYWFKLFLVSCYSKASGSEDPKKPGWLTSRVIIITVAGPTRLELAASGVTGQRYNRLNYGPAYVNHLVGGTGLEPVTLGL